MQLRKLHQCWNYWKDKKFKMIKSSVNCYIYIYNILILAKTDAAHSETSNRPMERILTNHGLVELSLPSLTTHFYGKHQILSVESAASSQTISVCLWRAIRDQTLFYKCVRDPIESLPLCCVSSDPQMLRSTHDSSQIVLLSFVLILETSARPREDDPDPPRCLSASNQRHKDDSFFFSVTLGC